MVLSVERHNLTDSVILMHLTILNFHATHVKEKHNFEQIGKLYSGYFSQFQGPNINSYRMNRYQKTVHNLTFKNFADHGSLHLVLHI